MEHSLTVLVIVLTLLQIIELLGKMKANMK